MEEVIGYISRTLKEKNGSVKGGNWCERESQEEADEEPVKGGWTCRNNGRVRLTKRADALRVEGRMRRGRPRLRWDDCMKRAIAGVGGERRMRTRDGGVETVETTVKWCLPLARHGATPLAGSWLTTWSHYCGECRMEPTRTCIVKGNKNQNKTHYVTSCSISPFSQHRNIY